MKPYKPAPEGFTIDCFDMEACYSWGQYEGQSGEWIIQRTGPLTWTLFHGIRYVEALTGKAIGDQYIGRVEAFWTRLRNTHFALRSINESGEVLTVAPYQHHLPTLLTEVITVWARRNKVAIPQGFSLPLRSASASCQPQEDSP